MKKLLRSRRGNLYVWAVSLAILLGMMLVWVSMYDVVHNGLVPILSSYSGDPENTNTWNILSTLFDNFPILLVLGVFLWAYVYAQKQEPGAGWI